MESNKGMVGMALGSWLVAFAGGTLAGTLAWVLFGWSFLQGAFLGAVVFLVAGVLVSWVMTRPLPRPGEVKINPPTPAAKASATKAAPINVAPAPTAAQVKPTARLAGEEELASRKGDWKYEKEAAPAPAPKKKAAPKKAPAKKAAPKAAAAPDGRPAYLSDAPTGTADDLKKISGVGPKLEQTLNELGVWHFEQVAQFKKKDIAWVDERLRFKGRIERDDWVGQAKALANAKD
ncbi:hypothetical protein [Roseobacter litoralis]|uniref:Uncharacterized protein n=1 Tax=Roseobacter litoralis (strain ATCC 49566 / DSM 6996 / JCM 21268 / NBRC 15278 / OCh 149) TaxID=391595 RepID=F7ZCP7_ROSLO|nr:hypothetical protein [Roseobacter litoralis]AEI94471.1 hypothetical protein RLO149_c025030 [Roseobacter litoralis Och 149]